MQTKYPLGTLLYDSYLGIGMIKSFALDSKDVLVYNIYWFSMGYIQSYDEYEASFIRYIKQYKDFADETEIYTRNFILEPLVWVRNS